MKRYNMIFVSFIDSHFQRKKILFTSGKDPGNTLCQKIDLLQLSQYSLTFRFDESNKKI